jgi:hypothetical protein
MKLYEISLQQNKYFDENMGKNNDMHFTNSPVKLGLKKEIIEEKLEMDLIASFWV